MWEFCNPSGGEAVGIWRPCYGIVRCCRKGGVHLSRSDWMLWASGLWLLTQMATAGRQRELSSEIIHKVPLQISQTSERDKA